MCITEFFFFPFSYLLLTNFDEEIYFYFFMMWLVLDIIFRAASIPEDIFRCLQLF